MKHLKHHWKLRTFVILCVSLIISALLITLELTHWAEQINQLGYSHGDNNDKRNIPEVMMYILPFIKEIVLIGIPLLLTLLWIKLFRKLKNTNNS